jgi:hypothetical protein
VEVAVAIRRFPAERLTLCDEWFNLIETNELWNDLGPIGEGESQAIRVCNAAGLVGVAKPGQPKTDDIARAAHEKIAFDLAHTLELPVPPVILWDRGDVHAANRYLSISAWAFKNAMKWDAAQGKGFISDASRASAGEAVSAMRVFHTWISDSDRKSDHTQVDVDSPDGQLGVAFIDHAYSMSYGWKIPNAVAGPCPAYMPAPELRDVMANTADLIAALPESEISRIINRVPVSYLPDGSRAHILANLLFRRRNLRTILTIT